MSTLKFHRLFLIVHRFNGSRLNGNNSSRQVEGKKLKTITIIFCLDIDRNYICFFLTPKFYLYIVSNKRYFFIKSLKNKYMIEFVNIFIAFEG